MGLRRRANGLAFHSGDPLVAVHATHQHEVIDVHNAAHNAERRVEGILLEVPVDLGIALKVEVQPALGLVGKLGVPGDEINLMVGAFFATRTLRDS